MEIKIITGMFKAADCELEVCKNSIVITGNDYSRSFELSELESISVTQKKTRAARLEISLKNEIIEGVFYKKSDADMFVNSLKETTESVLQVIFPNN